MTENTPIFTEENAKEELKKGYAEAEKVLADESRLEKLFQKLEKKLKKVPLVGNSLSHAAAIASLVRSYVKKGNEAYLPPAKMSYLCDVKSR